MRQLVDTAAQCESLTIGDILNIFGVRGFAFLLLILSLLNIVIFMIPFCSVVFGIPMVILGVQMLLGMETPVFPEFIRNRAIKRDTLIRGLNKGIYGVEKIERFIKPRMTFLTSPLANRIHGFAVLIMAVMVTLPVPLFNVPPSIGTALMAIGMLQRDGVFIVLAYAIGFWCLMLFKSIGHLAHSLTQ